MKILVPDTIPLPLGISLGCEPVAMFLRRRKHFDGLEKTILNFFSMDVGAITLLSYRDGPKELRYLFKVRIDISKLPYPLPKFKPPHPTLLGGLFLAHVLEKPKHASLQLYKFLRRYHERLIRSVSADRPYAN